MGPATKQNLNHSEGKLMATPTPGRIYNGLVPISNTLTPSGAADTSEQGDITQIKWERCRICREWRTRLYNEVPSEVDAPNYQIRSTRIAPPVAVSDSTVP